MNLFVEKVVNRKFRTIFLLMIIIAMSIIATGCNAYLSSATENTSNKNDKVEKIDDYSVNLNKEEISVIKKLKDIYKGYALGTFDDDHNSKFFVFIGKDDRSGVFDTHYTVTVDMDNQLVIEHDQFEQDRSVSSQYPLNSPITIYDGTEHDLDKRAQYALDRLGELYPEYEVYGDIEPTEDDHYIINIRESNSEITPLTHLVYTVDVDLNSFIAYIRNPMTNDLIDEIPLGNPDFD